MTTKVSDVMQETGSEAVGLVPIGAGIDYWGGTAPANWVFAYGQPLSRTTYAALFALYGTAYGAGDGSTTFNVPDKRSRASIGRDNMGGTPTNRVTNAVSGIAATSLGATGGSQLLHAHNHGVTDPGHTHDFTGNNVGNVGADTTPMSLGIGLGSGGTISEETTGITVDSAGTGNAQNMPPSIVCNYIIRVL